jgi:hypothetical protein
MSLEYNQNSVTRLNLDGIRFASNIDPQDVIERGVFLYDKPDRTFERWGHLTYSLIGRNHKGIFDVVEKPKWWEQNGEYKKMLFNTLYPHEEVQYQVNQLFENELVDSGMKIVRNHISHDGYTQYWEVLSDRFDVELKDSYRKDDVVQIGMMVRNGIGTGIALGIDLFTNCLVCLNGAVARGQDIGSIAISHVGDYEAMKAKFLEAIPNAINRAKDLIEYYQQAVYVKMTQKIAENFYTNLKDLTSSHYPEYFNLDDDARKDKEKRKDAKEIVNFSERDHLSVWEVFNDFTQDLWHANKMKFSGIRYNEISLHRALIQTVNANH